jgi:RHS repeat-associated protein
MDCLGKQSEEMVFFYHNDPLGSPLAMTDSKGNLVWQATYLPFGEEYSVTGGLANNRLFLGREKDVETGLSYFIARYLDVSLGRFISPDSVRVVDAATGKINTKILVDPQPLCVRVVFA